MHSQTENPKLSNGKAKQYLIIRYTWQKDKRIVKTGLSLNEAQAHCQNPKSSGNGWFDGYTEQKSSLDTNIYRH